MVAMCQRGCGGQEMMGPDEGDSVFMTSKGQIGQTRPEKTSWHSQCANGTIWVSNSVDNQ